MAQYMILIYENENAYATASPEEWQRIGKLHGQFAEQVGDKILGGNALQPTQTATSIRADVVTDGPFVETKEVLGGYYLIEAKDLDDQGHLRDDVTAGGRPRMVPRPAAAPGAVGS